jgi:hypothetical protein
VLVDVEGDEARFVPLADAEVGDATIRVAHSAATIRNAPGIGTEPRIDQSEERRLYEHYGIGYSTEESPSGLPAEEPETVEQDAVEPSSWSDAAKAEDAEPEPEPAPAPAEPPTPEEVEKADIPEPPAMSERADEPEEPDVVVVSPAAAGPSAEPEAQDAPEPVPPPETVLPSPAATSEPPEVFTPPEPPTPPAPPPAPEPPRSTWTPPEPEPESGGKLDAVKDRKAGVAIGVAIAAVLLILIRKLR